MIQSWLKAPLPATSGYIVVMLCVCVCVCVCVLNMAYSRFVLLISLGSWAQFLVACLKMSASITISILYMYWLLQGVNYASRSI